ncbi:MAG: YihY/virulence factor BrkB family protein, partial [Glaciihabitans sp.]|nr:YihY/virulence factor BrkB family protein [Glaciihabitans sp.]
MTSDKKASGYTDDKRVDSTRTDGNLPADKQGDAAPTGIAGIIAKVMKLKPVRVFTNYVEHRGVLLAAGLSYQAIFAAFAAIWVAFSLIGLFLASNDALQKSLFDLLGTSLPGLFSTDGADGTIDPQTLLNTGALSWTGAIALAGLLFTALGWLASGRDAVRTIFGIDPLPGNFFIRKLKDLGLAVGFGVALLVSAGLSVVSTAALGTVLGFVGFDEDSLVAIVLARIVGLAIVLILDTVVLALFFRYVAGIVIPRRRLVGGALLGGIGLGALKVLVSYGLVGGIGSNPLLASFAVIIGLLIWFNLICQVILLSAAWIAMGMVDAGIPLDPVAEAARLKKEAEEASARAAAAAEAARNRPNPVVRLFRRLRGNKADKGDKGAKSDTS